MIRLITKKKEMQWHCFVELKRTETIDDAHRGKLAAILSEPMSLQTVPLFRIKLNKTHLNSPWNEMERIHPV